MNLRATILILFLISFGKLFAQSENLNSSKYHFSKEVFEKKYSKQNFEKFKGKITLLSNNSIQFDEKKLTLYNVSQ